VRRCLLLRLLARWRYISLRCVSALTGCSARTDAVAALKLAQAADKLYKTGDFQQGLVAAANYRSGCAIFARIVDGAYASCAAACQRSQNCPRLLPAFLPCPPDANTDETAKAAIRPKIAQIRSRIKKLEAALPEAAGRCSHLADLREETAAATMIDARARGRRARRLAHNARAENQERRA